MFLLRNCFMHRLSLNLARGLGTFQRSTCQKKDASGKPTVLVCGYFMNDEDDCPVDRYANVHNELGYDTHHYVYPGTVFNNFDHRRMRDEAMDFMESVYDHTEGYKNGIVFHTISNSGYALFQHMYNLIYNPEGEFNYYKDGKYEQIKVRGAIFDSGPYPCTFLPSRLIGELNNLGTRRRMHRKYMLYDMYLHLRRKHNRRDAVSKLMTSQVPAASYMNWHSFWDVYPTPGHHALQMILPFPQLHLCSSRDCIAPANFVDMIMENQATTGQKTFKFDFEDSDHACHLISHSDLYKEKVKDFLGFIEYNVEH